MTSSQLPERPNLDQLKRQAKDLLQSARNRNPADLGRFRALPSLAGKSDGELAATSLALHDAQSVIAREHGFASWNAVREHVEERTLDFAAAARAFIEAATDGRNDRADRVLALQPAIARADFFTALVLGDLAVVEAQLQALPERASARGGPRDWEPLLYVCHTPFRRDEPATQARRAAIAQRLLAAGVDANSRFPWLHHGVRRSALWGACLVTANLQLARVLLEAGANPNDGVTLTLAASGGNIPVLDLLHEFRADPNHPWATDGAAPLYALLGWASTLDGARWLLEHGADPDPVFPRNGETPLHAAARRCSVQLVEWLVARGADPSRRRSDGRTPYALAELNGNRAVAEWLAAHGASTEMADVDRFVAACSRGDRKAAEALRAHRPTVIAELAAEHYGALHLAAERNDVNALEAMLACGFDPNRADEEMGKTPLHSAAHEGQTEAAIVLLRHGASPHATDREFHGTPLIWAADGARMHRDRDFTAVARALLAAGATLDWKETEEPAEQILEILADWRRL